MLAFDQLPEWDTMWAYGVRVEYTSEVNTVKDKYCVGATAQGIPENPGDEYCRFEVIESLEHTKIAYRASEEMKYLGTLSMRAMYSLEPVGTRTKITYILESEKFLELLVSSSNDYTIVDGQQRKRNKC